MSPKEYFKAYFSNEQDFKKIETYILADPLLDGFDYKEILDTSDYKYSNSIEFEQLVKGFLQNSPYLSCCYYHLTLMYTVPVWHLPPSNTPLYTPQAPALKYTYPHNMHYTHN